MQHETLMIFKQETWHLFLELGRTNFSCGSVSRWDADFQSAVVILKKQKNLRNNIYNNNGNLLTFFLIGEQCLCFMMAVHIQGCCRVYSICSQS